MNLTDALYQYEHAFAKMAEAQAKKEEAYVALSEAVVKAGLYEYLTVNVRKLTHDVNRGKV